MKREKKKKGFFRKSFAGAVAGVLAGVMLFSAVSPGLDTEAAKVADLDTMTKYTESLGDEYSTEYAGRVWTDKTVKEAADDNFQITYSALSTSTEVVGSTKAPLDVVFIIDISGSMVNSSSGMTDAEGNTYSRMKFTLDALNKSIDTLMEMNEHTRVAVVAFSTNASVLLPLGHYGKVNENTPYFTLSSNTPLSANVIGESQFPWLYTRVSGRTQQSTRVYGGTNIQHGVYAGMELLTNSETTAVIDGQTLDRVPVVIMLSDGSPTYSVDDSEWWKPDAADTQGNGQLAYYGNGMKAMMTATYMKAAINRNYTKNPAKFYTIGMGIKEISNTNYYNYRWHNDGAQDLAYMVLDPANHWNDDNTNATSIRDAWSRTGYGYATRRTNGAYRTPSVTVGGDSSYTLNHPNTYDIIETGIHGYVDAYYSADTADSVNNVFADIVSEISVSTPQVPTHVSGDDPLNDGYVVYSDPIGKYMEVKSVDSIVHRGNTYVLSHTEEPVTESGVTTTKYVFSHNVETFIHGTKSLSEIDVVLTEEADGSQTISVSIPAALIPLRINSVELNTDGTVKTHTHNGATPIQVNYTVGLMNGLKNADGTLNLEPQLEGFDQSAYEAYLEANSSNGIVNFYSNLYTGTHMVDGNTAGDTTVTFKAAKNNPFYYMQGDTLLYTDASCTAGTEAQGDALSADQLYYYKETYYHGLNVEKETVVRTGAQLTGNTKIIKKSDGFWYRQGGTVRVNRMLDFLGTKSLNNTNTASEFYAPTYDSASGNFVVYLGNNGVLGVTAAGVLKITKTVTAAEGLNAPDKEFIFTVALKMEDGSAQSGTYKYEVTDAEGSLVKTGTIEDGGQLILEAGQTAEIMNLPPNTSYEIIESAVAGFTASVDGSKGNTTSGTITAGEASEEIFTNHYEAEPVTFPTEGGIKGRKVLSGREWAEGTDSYSFRIGAVGNAPMPENAQVTVTKAQNNAAEFEFDQIIFTAPGLYRYTIMEMEPGTEDVLPGISYSRALYSLAVQVTDNGDGTLSVTRTNIQQLLTDEGQELYIIDDAGNMQMKPGQEAEDEIVFTNVYSTDSVSRNPVALKSYIDHSGNHPLTQRMFEFKLEAKGILENGKVVANTSADVPMPVDESGNRLDAVTAWNDATNVTFPAITFTHQDIPAGRSSITYRYHMWEVRPDGANAENNYTFNGMTYDPAIVEIDVKLSIDADEENGLIVDAVYNPEGRVYTFKNEYHETPVVLGEDTYAPIQGTKRLTGRDIKAGEFIFNLTAADAVTAQAVADGIVVPEKVSAKSVEGKDGVVTAFDFGTTTFKKQGSYSFMITEEVPDKAVDNGDGTYTLNGVTYDAHSCTVHIIVTDSNKDSILEAEVSYSNAPNASHFENVYKAVFDDSTAVSLDGTKKMTGRAFSDGEFFFEVALENNGAGVVYIPVTEGGTVKLFDQQTYTEAGTYTYLIKEQIPQGAVENADGKLTFHGVIYDSAIYRVVVTVTDDELGNLTASAPEITVSRDGGSTYTAVTAVQFENEYKTTPAAVTPYQIEKVLEGREWSNTDQFTFKKSVVSANPEDGVILPTPSEITITKADNGIIQFNDITFTKPGTYVIQIEEELPEGATEENQYTVDGITYSRNVIQSTFEVTDNGQGELIAVRTGTVGGRTFKNTYKTEGSLSGETNLKVTKEFDSVAERPWAEGESYVFIMVGHDDTTRKAIADGTVILPKTDSTDTELLEILASEVTTDVQNAAALRVKNEITAEGEADDVTKITGEDIWTKAEAFGDITFKQAGDYTFHIREVDGKLPGVDYDMTSRVITVKAEDNGDGTLDVNVTGITGGVNDDLTFVNIYDPDDVIITGHGNLHVDKILTGREWKNTDEFTFTIEPNMQDTETAAAVNAQPAEIEMHDPTEIKVTKDNKDYIHFGNITFKAVGRYEFIVTEAAGSIAGVTNDPDTDRIVVVTVTDNGDGTMSAAIDQADQDNETLQFRNTYDTIPGELTGATDLVIDKKLSGRGWMSGDSFTFTLEAAADDKTGIIVTEGETQIELTTAQAVEKGMITMPAERSKTVTDANGTSFGNIIFTKPGIYQFIITESESNIAGVKDDLDPVRRITVTVADDQNGNLIVTKLADASDSLTFTNTYEADPVTAKLEGIKKMSGRSFLATDAFEFIIRAHSETPSAPLPSNTRIRVTGEANAESWKVAFDEIEFTAAGTYHYVVSELLTTIGGVTADSNAWNAIITVGDNQTTGKLEISSVKYIDAAGAENTTGYVFTNVYNPEDVILSGEANLKVTKVVDGRHWFTTDSFTFTLTADDQVATGLKDGETELTTVEAVEKGYVVMPASAITIGKDTLLTGESAKTKAFGNIKFTEAGTYTFVIAEDQGSIDLDYDSHSETVTVVVTDDGSGSLKASVTSADKDYTFTNKYTPADASANIHGKKQLNGRVLKAGEFKFTITAENNAPLPTVTTVGNASDGTIVFGTIDYKAPGTYKYVITEEDEGLSGVAYDKSSWNITVQVMYDPHTGTYDTPVITYQKNDITNQTGFTFVNTYTTNGTDPVTFEAKKTVSAFAGSSFTLKGGEFEFKITADSANPAGDPISSATVTNSADGAVKFAENVVYTEEGTYVYTIEEIAGRLEGMVYDSSKYTVTVTVADNEAVAKLQKTVVIEKNNTVVDAITFKNEYRPGSAVLEGNLYLTVDKKFTGRANNQWLDSDAFTFKLTPDTATAVAVEAGKVVLPTDLTLTVTKNNKDSAHFGDIIFTETGNYTFLITEVDSGQGGITYDGHTMKVEVQVTDNQTGKLLVAVPAASINKEFINTYGVEPVTATLKGKKNLSGRVLKAEEFSFEITAVTKDAPLPSEAIVKNDGNGNIVFAPITFEKAGEYTYEITEKSGSLKGVTYDSVKAEAIVKVTDNNDGTLSAAVSYKKNGVPAADGFTFENSYKATPVSLSLDGIKRVTDQSNTYKLKANAFTFKLTPASSNPTGDPYKEQSVKNDAAGKFTFTPNGQYTQPGTYIYDITEVSQGAAGIVYDGSIYKVTVVIEDIGGSLTAKSIITKDDKAAEAVEFVNKYVPENATAVIAGKKVLHGKDLENAEYSFVIEAVNDLAKETLPSAKTVTNDETGVFQFDSLVYTKAGDYIYHVREVQGTKPGVTYDASVYEVIVTVTGDGIVTEDVKDPITQDPSDQLATPPTEPEGTVNEPTEPEGTVTEPTESEKPEGTVTEPTEPEKPEGTVTEPTEPEKPEGTVTEPTESAKPEETMTEPTEVKEPVISPAGLEEPIEQDESVTPPAEPTILEPQARINWLKFVLTGTNGQPAVQNTGKLYASVKITKAGANVDEIKFENSYKPEEVTVGKGTKIPLKGTKKLSGRTLKAGEFVFELISNDANAPLPADPTAVNAADGSFEFNQITFDKVGTYYYTIVERNNGLSGVTYDMDGYTVKIIVSDVGFDGQLDAVAEIYKGTEKAAVVFENHYQPTDAIIQLSAAKHLNGRSLKAGEFEFVIKAVTKGAPMPAETKVKNNAKGAVIFGEMKFTAPGSYTYQVSEVQGSLKGVTYDNTVYEVTVNVTDNLKGQLIASVDENFKGMTFTNTYKTETPKETPKEEPKDTPKEEPKQPTAPQVSPKTGDSAAIALTAAIAVLGIAGIAGIEVYKRKKTKTKIRKINP